MRTYLLLFLATVLTTGLFAQVGMGQWRTHFSYNETTLIEETDTEIFGISDGALFSIEKSSDEVKTYSKITGQNDFNASLIRYNKTTKSLLISYQNGNLDLLTEYGIDNIPDIKNKTIAADKTANDIFFDNEFAYISSGIGIVVVNLSKKEITDSYIIGHNNTPVGVKSVAFFADSIYALTADGLYVAKKNNPILVDYNNWHFRTNTVLSSAENKKLSFFNNRLYLLKTTGEVYSSADAIDWTVFDNSLAFTGLRVCDNQLLLHNQHTIVKYNQALSSESLSGLKMNDVLYNTTEAVFWVASADSSGILKIQSGSITNQYKPDGPATNDIFTVTHENDRLFAITGGSWDTEDEDRVGAVMIFENNRWKNIVNMDVSAYANKDFADLTQIAVDKVDLTHFFVSSWGEGVYEFKNDLFVKRYNYTNSTIEDCDTYNIDGLQNMDGVCYDNNNHLWMNATFVANSIKVMLNNGTWIEMNYPPISNKCNLDKIIVTKNNYKWMNLSRTKCKGGVFVLDDKNNPSNYYEHQYRYFSSVIDQDGNEVSIDPVFCLANDKKESVWIGTSTGVIVFDNIEQVFSSNYRVTRPKIARNDGSNYADFLLEGEMVKSIAVDGANRKWIGTAGSGIYLMSEDGIETIHHFTTENSPILSNTILSIAINDKTGEVFFATDLGLISFMSNATSPTENYANIQVYPNPVKENFSGLITINGLMDDTTVKITNTTGQLVYQTKSNGGTATWNGFIQNGQKASTGIYFIMVSNSSENNLSPSTAIGKIMIIK